MAQYTFGGKCIVKLLLPNDYNKGSKNCAAK